MSLFKVKATPITKLGITAYPVVPEFFNTITSYLNSLEKNNLTYSMSLPMLVYGGNRYFQEIDGYLYLYRLYKNNPELICVPFNKKGECLDIHGLFDYMREFNILKILAVPECSDWYNYYDVENLFYVHSSGEGYEYIYDNEEMFNMKGKKWSNFRHKVDKFIRDNGEPQLIPYSNELSPIFLSVYDKWKFQFASNHTASIWDTKFYQITIKMFHDTNFLIKLHDKFIGVVGFAPMSNNIFYGMHRKLLYEQGCQYIARYLQWKQAEILWRQYGVKYLNDGCDGNISGLRELKHRMHPIMTFKSFVVGRNV